jgi:hypothetical protein
LSAGQYQFKLQREGYITWQRGVTVEGGSVEHFDYPFLFPAKLTSSTVKDYANTPQLSLQSPSRQWLLIPSADSFGKFDEFNLQKKTAADVEASATTITIPSDVLTPSTGTQSWQLEEWSTDNDHVILKHIFEEDGQAASEYILLDRGSPEDSINLTNTLGTNPSELEFVSKGDYKDYYVYDQASGTLDTASLSAPTPQPYLKNILNFYPYSKNELLYATTQNAPSGKAIIDLRQGDTTYPIRQVAATTGATYLLDFTQYSGDWYVAAGVSTDNSVNVYEDPQAQLKAEPDQVIAPIAILKVTNPNQVSFSSNAQFIAVEGGSTFAVYDAQNEKSYTYTIKAPLDSPRQYATWMDGDRLMYVSAGKVVVFDFDGGNKQTLSSALPDLLPMFDSNYRYLYTYASVPATSTLPATTALQATPMLIPKDQ